MLIGPDPEYLFGQLSVPKPKPEADFESVLSQIFLSLVSFRPPDLSAGFLATTANKKYFSLTTFRAEQCLHIKIIRKHSKILDIILL